MSAEDLVRSPVFAGLAASLVRDTEALFVRRAYRAGQTIWREGEEATELAVLVTGRLTAFVATGDVGEIHAGDLVGAAALFLHEVRSATVQAAQGSTMYVLDSSGLNLLGESFPAVYDHLLDAALREVARRVRAVDVKIAQRAAATDTLPTVGPATRLLRALRRVTTTPDAPPTAEAALRQMPRLSSAPLPLLTSIAAGLTLRGVDADTCLFQEGDEGDSAFVVAAGGIKVLRNVRGGGARRLATLGPGAVVGTGSLLLGERRNASAVTVGAVRLFEMDSRTLAGLGGPAGRAWRMSLLTGLRHQVVGASLLLARLKSGADPDEEDTLSRAQARLLAWHGDGPEPRDGHDDD